MYIPNKHIFTKKSYLGSVFHVVLLFILISTLCVHLCDLTADWVSMTEFSIFGELSISITRWTALINPESYFDLLIVHFFW